LQRLYGDNGGRDNDNDDCCEYGEGDCGVYGDLGYGNNDVDNCTVAAANGRKNNHESGSSDIYTRGFAIFVSIRQYYKWLFSGPTSVKNLSGALA
jgi:hypothetical protein